MNTEEKPKRLPIPVTKLEVVFSGKLDEILPPMSEIPDEFKRNHHPWVKWQREWFFHGLKHLPEPKEGIDLNAAMANLRLIQGSFAPKHEHKEAGAAYLASLWLREPGERNANIAEPLRTVVNRFSQGVQP